MEMQLALKLIAVMARAILGNSFNIRQLMATTYHTLLVAESSVIAAAGFTAGRAYATEAQRLRDLHAADTAQHRAPELVMGRACVQVFLQIALAVRDAGDQVGFATRTSGRRSTAGSSRWTSTPWRCWSAGAACRSAGWRTRRGSRRRSARAQSRCAS
eukprot:8357845-Pyramimonas_sp.AAC.1